MSLDPKQKTFTAITVNLSKKKSMETLGPFLHGKILLSSTLFSHSGW